MFDVAEQVVLVELDEADGGDRVTESLGDTGPHARAQRLVELGVDLLVCGAISWPLEALLAAGGIRVISFVCGQVEEVVQALRDGSIKQERFSMPGCCRRGRHGRTRRRRGGGGLRTEDMR